MVMGDNSCTKGCGFKSQCCILDGHFSTLICCKNCNVCLKRPKINEKEAEVGPFKKRLKQFVFVKTILILNSLQTQHMSLGKSH